MTTAEIARGKAEWAERKADEAAGSDKPWSMGNLRNYQNLASKFWGEHFAALRTESKTYATPTGANPNGIESRR